MKALFAAILMVGLDYFIEPVAMKYDFWHWQNNVVPIQNFVAWFVLAFGLQVYFQKTAVYKNNPLAAWVFGVQAAFFIALNYFI
jgi:putative membrane protein